MKSKITIEIDFSKQKNTPIVQIISTHSADVRDAIVNAFVQNGSGQNRWARILYKGMHNVDGKDCPVWVIEPVPMEDLQAEISLMQATVDMYMGTPKEEPAPLQNIATAGDALPREQGIYK